jgi:putative SOS response-associated peptidase YedK
MCYSSQIESAYARYLRETGAEMDLDQFTEIYGFSVRNSAVRIPRAVDRWFDNPDTDKARAIHALICQRNAAMVGKLTADLFAQRRRLADAQRALQVKATKKAAEDKRIATSKIEQILGRLPLYQGTAPTALDARIFPFHHAPIVIEEQGRRVLRLARYHCRQARQPASIDRQRPGLYNARRDNLEKYWRDEFGHRHALMLAWSLYENVERDGRNVVLHFSPRPQQLMRIACIYSEWMDPATGENLLSFAAVTDEPPADVAAAGHDRFPVNLSSAAADRWLAPAGRSAPELQAVLDDREQLSYEYEVLAA